MWQLQNTEHVVGVICATVPGVVTTQLQQRQLLLHAGRQRACIAASIQSQLHGSHLLSVLLCHAPAEAER